jgi:hypothetical protein
MPDRRRRRVELHVVGESNSISGLYGFSHLSFQTAFIGKLIDMNACKQFAGYEEKRKKA